MWRSERGTGSTRTGMRWWCGNHSSEKKEFAHDSSREFVVGVYHGVRHCVRKDKVCCLPVTHRMRHERENFKLAVHFAG